MNDLLDEYKGHLAIYIAGSIWMLVLTGLEGFLFWTFLVIMMSALLALAMRS